MVARKFNTKRVGVETISATPSVEGVYMIMDRYDRVQYVGKSNNLSRRLMEHLDTGDVLEARSFKAYQMKTEEAARNLESHLTRRYYPPYNFQQTQGCED